MTQTTSLYTQNQTFHQVALDMHRELPSDCIPSGIFKLIQQEVAAGKGFIDRIIECPGEALTLLMIQVKALYDFYILGIDCSPETRLKDYQHAFEQATDENQRLYLMGLIALLHYDSGLDVNDTLSAQALQLTGPLQQFFVHNGSAPLDVLNQVMSRIDFVRFSLEDAAKHQDWANYIAGLRILNYPGTNFENVPDQSECEQLWQTLPYSIRSLARVRNYIEFPLNTARLSEAADKLMKCSPSVIFKMLKTRSLASTSDSQKQAHFRQLLDLHIPELVELDGGMTRAELGCGVLEEFLKFSSEAQQRFVARAVEYAEQSYSDDVNPFKLDGELVTEIAQKRLFMLGLSSMFLSQFMFNTPTIEAVRSALETTDLE